MELSSVHSEQSPHVTILRTFLEISCRNWEISNNLCIHTSNNHELSECIRKIISNCFWNVTVHISAKCVLTLDRKKTLPFIKRHQEIWIRCHVTLVSHELCNSLENYWFSPLLVNAAFVSEVQFKTKFRETGGLFSAVAASHKKRRLISACCLG